MRVPSVVIEAVAGGAAPELIEVAAADPVSLSAVSRLRSNDGVSFVPARPVQGLASAPLDRSPAMFIDVGDARVPGCAATLIGMRKRGVLSVAVVAVESLQSRAAIDALARAFDAVLPLAVARSADGNAPLAGALAAVTAFATADCISIPVDEIYPFFVRGGPLAFGSADGDDVVGGAALALEAARLDAGAQRLRMQLHIETTRRDLLQDLELAAGAVRRAVRLDDLWVTASVTRGQRKGISLVASGQIP